MPLYSYKEFIPEIGSDCFIAPNADIIGRTKLGNNASIWFGCCLRGDVNEIIVGNNTNVQDLSMLHVTAQSPLHIGNNVSIGHNVVLHGCTIKDSCLIGMGAVILDNAVINENSVVAGGSVVPPGKIYPPKSLIMGNPAKVVRELTDVEAHGYANHYKSYVGYSKEYLGGDFKRLD